MLLIQYMAAYTALSSLMNCSCDYQTAHAFSLLHHQLKPHALFFQEEEFKLARKYGQKDKNGQLSLNANGSFPFIDADAADRYRSEHLALEQTKVPALEPTTVKPPERMTAAQLQALEGLLVFDPMLEPTKGKRGTE